jgi:hypothetical protein
MTDIDIYVGLAVVLWALIVTGAMVWLGRQRDN